MANNFPHYFKKFVNRNLINNSLRQNRKKETGNFTTITDVLLLGVLPILTLANIIKKVFNKKGQ
jgi:hypothetical protein